MRRGQHPIPPSTAKQVPDTDPLGLHDEEAIRRESTTPATLIEASGRRYLVFAMNVSRSGRERRAG